MNGGSCNGCDIELIASLTPRYDAEQLGVRLEGSPRHADILCITGPITHNAVNAIKTVYDQVCGPKAVVAIGSCPATTNVFIDSRTLDGPLNRHVPVDVFVPGCPPRPDAIIQGVAKAAEILAERAGKKLPIAPVVMPLVGPGCGGACACGGATAPPAGASSNGASSNGASSNEVQP
jgi:membrane-bound hydrogenase subunit mbhJ